MTTTHWLLGLPFDAVTLDETRERVFEAVESRKQLLLATPNVNFLAMANRDSQFRDDVLNTGLSVADGMPVIWIGKMLGIPFKGRVAGSDLLESLINRPGRRVLRVFFFGGEADTAEAAARAVNGSSGGLVAVGSHFPGFVDVSEMSTDAVIDAINRSNADLLILALGAAKGHRWMEANKHRLNTPVLCHLGAAVNFVAGKLQRAPRFIQKLGLEWLWRIKEEPVLYARYAKDGLFLLGVLVQFGIPEWIKRHTSPHRGHAMNLKNSCLGRVSVAVCDRFGETEVASLASLKITELTLASVKSFDAFALGWLYSIRYRESGRAVKIICDATSRVTLKTWRAEVLSQERR